jgi:hypothetical protein
VLSYLSQVLYKKKYRLKGGTRLQNAKVRASATAGQCRDSRSARTHVHFVTGLAVAVEEGRAFSRALATLHPGEQSGASQREHQSSYRCGAAAFS